MNQKDNILETISYFIIFGSYIVFLIVFHKYYK